MNKFTFLLLVCLVGCGSVDKNSTNAQNLTGIPRLTPEIEKICEKHVGYRQLKEVTPTDQIVTSNPNACGHQCRILLLKYGFKYIESKTSELYAKKYAQELKSDKDFLRAEAMMSAVDGPGWHRFEEVKMEDPRAKRWVEGRTLELSADEIYDEEIKYDGTHKYLYFKTLKETIKKLREEEGDSFLGKAIISKSINGPTFRYRIEDRDFHHGFIQDGAGRVHVFGQVIVDSETDEVIASQSALEVAMVMQNKNGKTTDFFPAVRMCNGSPYFSSKNLTEIFKPELVDR